VALLEGAGELAELGAAGVTVGETAGCDEGFKIDNPGPGIGLGTSTGGWTVIVLAAAAAIPVAPAAGLGGAAAPCVLAAGLGDVALAAAAGLASGASGRCGATLTSLPSEKASPA